MLTFYRKHRNFIAYTFYGAIASTINISIFFLLHKALGWNLVISNTIAWTIALTFSFFINKHAVYHTKYDTLKSLMLQLISFMGFRIFSLVLDNVLTVAGLTYLYWNELLVKIATQIILGIFNYFNARLIFERANKRMERENKKQS